jgi:hypothetical protein
MTFDDPGDGSFEHLDDPAPPIHGSEALSRVVQRGHQIRRRRRVTYSASTAVVIVAIGGAVFGLANSGHLPGNGQAVAPVHSPTSSRTPHSHSPRATTTTSPNGVGQRIGTTPHPHPHHPTVRLTPPTLPVCVSSSPSANQPPADPTTSPTASADGTPGSTPPSEPASPTASPTPTPTCVLTTVTATPTATPTGTSTAPNVASTS